MRSHDPAPSRPRHRLFICYAHEDEALCRELVKHLSPLRRTCRIEVFYDRAITAGATWRQEVSRELDDAHIIVLLVSPDFIASEYCYKVETTRALERRAEGAHVVPVILRDVDWNITPLGEIQALPCDGRPITQWEHQDAAFAHVARRIAELLRDSTSPTPLPSPRRIDVVTGLPPALLDRLVSLLPTKMIRRLKPTGDLQNRGDAEAMSVEWFSLVLDVVERSRRMPSTEAELPAGLQWADEDAVRPFLERGESSVAGVVVTQTGATHWMRWSEEPGRIVCALLDA